MATSTRLLIAAVALLIGTGAASARDAVTAAALSMREGPGTNYTRLLTMPAGARVRVGGCSAGWCAVTWNGTSGYASQSGLLVRTARAGDVVGPELWPIYPPYPYRSGHYPKADWYDDMPPYTAIDPSFYHKRFFMMAQERNRYRYMPHIFRGSADAYGDGGPIEDIDIQAVSAGLRSSYGE